MKTFKQFLTEAKIDTSERDDKIRSYLEKKYNIKKKNNIKVWMEGSQNDISIRISAGAQPSLTNYKDMVEFNKNLNKFFANENIDTSKLKSFIGMGVSRTILNFNVDSDSNLIYVDKKFRDKIIKDAGGAKEFNNKYGDKSSIIFSENLNLNNTKVADIVKKGSFDVVFPKGTINIPIEQLYWFHIDVPSFAISLKDNYTLVKNSGAAVGFSPIKFESFVNDVNKTVDILNNIAVLFEGNNISNKEIIDLSSDLTKQAAKFRKNLKTFIKSRINELKNSYDDSNEKSIIEVYLSKLKELLNIL